MTSALKSSTALSTPAGPTEQNPDTGLPPITAPIEQIGLPHVPRELSRIVEPGQIIPSRARIYHLICEGELQMIQFIRGRWYCPRPELPNLAQALGLRLKQPEPSRSASRRSAA
jgi:hypothetical protein